MDEGEEKMKAEIREKLTKGALFLTRMVERVDSVRDIEVGKKRGGAKIK